MSDIKKTVDSGADMSNGERRVFFLCNGEVPCCKKTMCYKNNNTEDEVCRHTINVAYALNFKRGDDNISYFESPQNRKRARRVKVLKEILQELIRIRKELQAIRSNLEFRHSIAVGGSIISHLGNRD